MLVVLLIEIIWKIKPSNMTMTKVKTECVRHKDYRY